jgi:hypothetical protein
VTKKKKLLLGLISGVVFVSGLLHLNYSSNKSKAAFSQLMTEYPPVNLQTGIAGYVSEIVQPDITVLNNHPHQAFVNITPGNKCLIMVGLDQDQRTLDEVLMVGDYVLKKRDSSNLSLLRINSSGDSVRFTFTITDLLGFPLKAVPK